MAMVLAHPLGSLSSGHLTQLFFRLLLSFIPFLLATACIPAVTAQGITAQAPNDGLSVLDAPAPNSVQHTGSNMSIAIDVSAGISGTFVYNSLEVYLVSAQANINITVSAGPQLLAQEPGSTVKHLNWPIATCLQTGDYNLTIYESSSMNGMGFFAVMPVPVQIQNNLNEVSDIACSPPTNAVQAQPQASNPPPVDLIPGRNYSPSSGSSTTSTTSSSSFTASMTSNSDSATITSPPNSTLASISAQETAGGIITVTAGNGEITIPLSDLPGTIVVEPSGGAPPDSDTSSGFTTVFKTVAPTATATITQIISEQMTITFEETFVSTFTQAGQTLEVTVTQTQLSTIELVQTQVSSPQQAGLLPVNAASSISSWSFVPLFWTLLASALCYVLLPSFPL